MFKQTAKSKFKFKRKSETLFLIAVIAFFLTFGFAKCYQRYLSTSAYRKDYKGRIINKSVTFIESLRGSSIEKRLTIKDKNGEEFLVIVNDEIYERAEVGMWIVKNGDKITLMSL